MNKIYTVEAIFENGDSYVGGCYTSLDNAIKAVKVWANDPAITEVREVVKLKDFTILEAVWEGCEVVTFMIENWYLDKEIPETF